MRQQNRRERKELRRGGRAIPRQKGELCLNITKWPVDVNEMDLRLQKTMPTGTAGRMAALEAVGPAKSEDTEVDIMGIMDKPTGAKAKIKRYTLTDAAKPFEQTKEVERIGLNGKTKETQLTCAGARRRSTRCPGGKGR